MEDISVENTPEHSHQEGEGAIYVVLFIVVGMLFGAILREVNKRTKFPYTPQLLFVGLLLGSLYESLGHLGEGVYISAQISPHLLLYVFIPVLIFESAFNCDWYIFKRSLINIVLLAGPGVLFGAVLLAFSIKILLGYSDDELNWYQAFTFGAVLSATDPVAVVALLKQLGASIRFNTLIEGESLCNDGTAMVFYMVFVELAKIERERAEGNTEMDPSQIQEGPISFIEVLLKFMRFALGGPLLGFFIGIIAAFFMKRIVRDEVQTTCVTFIACFTSFYLAEFTSLHVSGILSLVVLGLYLSATGKTKIYPESEHALHVVWSFVQYVCQTIIFLLTGVIIGVKVIEEATITASDWIRMIVFWFLMQFMRLVMLACALPVLSNSGYPVNRKEFIVLVYGGLRGALGLSLALMVYVDNTIHNERFQQLTLFYMSGMATLTLLVNGTTCGPLVNYLQMIHIPAIKHKLFQNCKVRIHKQMGRLYEELENSRHLAMTNWKRVRTLLHIDRHLIDRESISDYSGMPVNEIFEELRFRILKEVKRIIWQLYENGHTSQAASKIVEGACDIQMDCPNERFNFWELVRQSFGSRTVNLLNRIGTVGCLKKMADSWLLDHMFIMYDSCYGLIKCLEEIKELCHKVPIRQAYLKKIMEEIDVDLIKTKSFMSELELAQPLIVRAVQTRMATYELLNLYKTELDEALSKGIIEELDYKQERKSLDEIGRQAEQIQAPSEPQSIHQLAADCPILSSLNYEQINRVAEASAERKYIKGQRLTFVDKEVQSIFLIRTGTAAEMIGEERRFIGAGQLAPVMDLLNKVHRCTVNAFTDCSVLQIKASTLSGLIKENPAFEARVYKSSLPTALKSNEEFSLFHLQEEKIRKIAIDATFRKLRKDETVSFENGGFLFEGSLVVDGDQTRPSLIKQFGDRKVSGLGQISGSFMVYRAEIGSVVLMYSKEIERVQHDAMLE